MQIQVCLQGKMIKLGLSLEHLKLDKRTQAGEDVICLGCDRVHRRAFERGILLQGLMERLNGPSFLIERGDAIIGEHGVTADHAQRNSPVLPSLFSKTCLASNIGKLTSSR